MRGVGDAGADRGIETIPRPRKVVGWGSLPGRSKMDQWLSNLSPFETYLLVVPAIILERVTRTLIGVWKQSELEKAGECQSGA